MIIWPVAVAHNVNPRLLQLSLSSGSSTGMHVRGTSDACSASRRHCSTGGGMADQRLHKLLANVDMSLAGGKQTLQ